MGRIEQTPQPGHVERDVSKAGANGNPVDILTQTVKDALAGKLPLGANTQHGSEDKSLPSSVSGS